MLIVAEDFYGIFSPKGELEAVDSTMSIAEFSAANLSPDRNRPNRVIKRVVICLPDENETPSAEGGKPDRASGEARPVRSETAGDSVRTE